MYGNAWCSRIPTALTVFLLAAPLRAADGTPAAGTLRAAPASATAGIQEAIDALPETGGQVMLAAGLYEVSESVKLGSNTALVGAGPATIIRLADGAGSGANEVHVITNRDPENGNRNIRVAHLAVDGNVANQGWSPRDIGGCGIAFDHADDVVIEDVRVFNTWRHGIWYHNGSGATIRNIVAAVSGSNNISVGGQYHFRRFTENVTIENARLSDTRRTLGRPTAGNGGLEINDHIRNVQVSNCVSHDHPTGSGFVLLIHARGRDDQDVRGVSLVNCVAYNNGQGFSVASSGNFDISDVSISNCAAIDNQGHGFRVASAESAEVRNVSIQGSLARGNGRDGIHVAGSTVRNLVVSGNRLVGNRGSGISLAGVADAVIAHNLCAENGRFGIEDRAPEVLLQGNLLRNNAAGALASNPGRDAAEE